MNLELAWAANFDTVVVEAEADWLAATDIRWDSA
jgi:hypothetical protein